MPNILAAKKIEPTANALKALDLRTKHENIAEL